MEEDKLTKRLVRIAALKIIQQFKRRIISSYKISDKPYPMINWTGRVSTNITGMKMGQLTIIGYIGNEKESRAEGIWQAQCECGLFQKIYRNNNINNMKTTQNIKCSMCCFQEELEKSIDYTIQEIESKEKLKETIEKLI